jgi:hypothetical protein
MVIVIASSPSESFSITTLRDGVGPASFFGRIADDHILPSCRIDLFSPNQDNMVLQV